MLRDRKILLAVTGGIAAYKSCELTRLLLKNGASVQVIMTVAATKFVSPLTFEALTGHSVSVDLFSEGGSGTHHLELVRDVDFMVVAPATANSIGKLAYGLADDLVSCSALALSSPLLICPAMNAKMYAHPAVQDNLRILNQRGVIIMEPEEGQMASPAEEPGSGRLPEPYKILHRICELLPPQGHLKGKIITITAGPTVEPIDPVRVISNLSSGKMGYALAHESRRLGAEVNLITGPVSIAPPPGLNPIRIKSTAEMLEAVSEAFDKSDALIMSAAPADFQPTQYSDKKIKKRSATDPYHLELQPTIDILKQLSSKKGKRVIIGFALETHEGKENALLKLRDKHLDFIVLNAPVSGADAGVGKDNIIGTIIEANGKTTEYPALRKTDFARVILTLLQKKFGVSPVS